MEERGTPAVILCDRGFLPDAASAASSRGMPAIRSLGVVGSSPSTEDIRQGITGSMEEIISALTRPLTDEEESPKPVEYEKPSRIVFKGNLEEVDRFFYKRGWTDGLPIMPPTEEAVAEMLTGTDLPPDHIVTTLIPRLGKATVEKIAVNAVMAGALPTFMPILIAAVRVLMNPDAYFGTYEVSTGSWAPCCLVNGPIRKELHINSGAGAMSPGDRANAAIGRALGLIVKNIGGVRKGVEDMGVMGNPMKYSLVIAENEEESPWEPLHVQLGFNKADSAVTFFFPNNLIQTLSYGPDADGILRAAAYNIPPYPGGRVCLLLTPKHAQTLGKAGWTRGDISNFISEYARAPLSHHLEYWGTYRRGEKSSSDGSTSMMSPSMESEPDRMLLMSPNDAPDESMSILRNPGLVKTFVVGGPGGFIGMLIGGSLRGAKGWVTQKVELPANWEKLVKKYKGIVPTYGRY